jgi:23S rRNA (cytidine1920-2'-O)/16S rRNA (cytidine1409-2'-O)-methyltransferase
MTRKRADLLLLERGLFDSRAKARAAIEAGGVKADGKVVAKPSEGVEDTAVIEAHAAHPWVGRGALKLVHALDLWTIAVDGRTAVDIGASTGGFSQVLLSRGAAKVFAVDVGRGQLHAKVAADPRLIDLSGVDARDLDAGRIDQVPDLVVSDVSFISQEKALPAVLALAAPGADLVTLVKPQFEVGHGNVGKGGLVKDEAACLATVATIAGFLETSGWTVRATAQSPIVGGEGQVEYLIWATKR